MSKNTPSGGNAADAEACPNTNGRNGADPFADVAAPEGGQPTRQLAEEPVQADDAAPSALSATLLAHLGNIDPDTPVNEALTPEALAAFNTYNNARRNVGLTPHAADAPLHDVGALPIAVAHLMGQEPTRAEVTAWSVEAVEVDPHELMDEFNSARADLVARRAEETAAERKAKYALRDANVPTRARFAMAVIEDIEDIGSEVAQQARAAVLKINRQAWSAIRPHNYTERNDLISAVELARLGVPVAVIGALVDAERIATDDDEIDANERLTRQREHYKKHGTTQVIDVAGGMVSPTQMRDKEPPRRMLGHWLYYAQLSELIAEPGGGKTFVALGAGLSLAAGQPQRTIGLTAPRRTKVLYVAAEAHESVYLRVLGWCHHHDVEPSALDGWFEVYPGAVQLGDLEHMRQLRKYVNDNDVDLLILDTRHMVTMGMDENSSGEQGVAIRALKDMNDDGVATLVVHHTTKDGKVGNGGRGAGAWFAAAYTSMYLTREDKRSVLVCDKIKDGQAKCRHPLSYAQVQVPVELMPKARADERHTQTLIAIDPHTVLPDPSELNSTQLAALLAVAQLAGAKGISNSELLKYTNADGQSNEGYAMGKSATVNNSLRAMREGSVGGGVPLVRLVSERPQRYRATDAGWDLLVAKNVVTDDYVAAHRFTVEDVGSEQFAAASTNIANAMTELIASGQIITTNNQTEAAARKLVESELRRKEREFSTTAWAAVYSRWKEDARPAAVTTANND